MEPQGSGEHTLRNTDLGRVRQKSLELQRNWVVGKKCYLRRMLVRPNVAESVVKGASL